MAITKSKKDLELIQECRVLVRKNPHLKKRKLNTIKDLEKRLYYIKVWVITESQPIFKLKDFEKRCYYGKSCYHLDHIVPISHGYHNKIPPEKIGSITNLRFIPSEENMKKGYKITEDSHKVLRKFKRKGDIYKKKK
jgi:hypothetical protein